MYVTEKSTGQTVRAFLLSTLGRYRVGGLSIPQEGRGGAQAAGGILRHRHHHPARQARQRSEIAHCRGSCKYFSPTAHEARHVAHTKSSPSSSCSICHGGGSGEQTPHSPRRRGKQSTAAEGVVARCTSRCRAEEACAGCSNDKTSDYYSSHGRRFVRRAESQAEAAD